MPCISYTLRWKIYPSIYGKYWRKIHLFSIARKKNYAKNGAQHIGPFALSSSQEARQIFRVVNAFHYPPNFTRRDEYTLQNLNGVMLMSGAVPRRFFGSEMVLDPPNYVDTPVQPLTIHRADQMNRLV